MKRKQTHKMFLVAFTFAAALIAARPATAQDAKQPYPTMAPVEQYLMDRDAEIALARSAAPDAISRDASVIVLTRHGYETAVPGTNGWVCWVGRGWMAMFDHPEFLEPKSSRCRLPQSTGRPLRSSVRLQTHRINPGRPFQTRSDRCNESGNR